ncbi:MAG: hypothetical protein QXV22_01640 [Thermoplasmataceae archaeon]
MAICGKGLLSIVLEKVARVFDPVIYSKVDLPFDYIIDTSENIVQLVSRLSRIYSDGFALIGGDMPFFTVDDLNILLSSFKGITVVPRHMDGAMEPLFAIYHGKLAASSSLIQSIENSPYHGIPAEKFSKYAFFNVNTEDDLELANEICDGLV